MCVSWYKKKGIGGRVGRAKEISIHRARAGAKTLKYFCSETRAGRFFRSLQEVTISNCFNLDPTAITIASSEILFLLFSLYFIIVLKGDSRLVSPNKIASSKFCRRVNFFLALKP